MTATEWKNYVVSFISDKLQYFQPVHSIVAVVVVVQCSCSKSYICMAVFCTVCSGWTHSSDRHLPFYSHWYRFSVNNENENVATLISCIKRRQRRRWRQNEATLLCFGVSFFNFFFIFLYHFLSTNFHFDMNVCLLKYVKFFFSFPSSFGNALHTFELKYFFFFFYLQLQIGFVNFHLSFLRWASGYHRVGVCSGTLMVVNPLNNWNRKWIQNDSNARECITRVSLTICMQVV